jgi:hypothetical protein
MKYKYFAKLILHIIIFFYMIILFYWQSANYNNLFYRSNFILKIAFPFLIKGFCYENVHKEFFGSLVTCLNDIFLNKLLMNVDYFYCDEMIKMNNFDCLLVIDNVKKYKNFIYSLSLCNEVNVLSFYSKKRKLKCNSYIALQQDMLYYTYQKNENYVFFKTIKEAVDFFMLHSDYLFLCSHIYYNDVKNMLISKFKEDQFGVDEISVKIKPLYLLFNNKLYWMVALFNRLMKQKKEKEYKYGIKSINYF